MMFIVTTNSFNGVSTKMKGFRGSFYLVSMYLKEVQREFQRSFKSVSRKIHGCSNKVFRVLQD